MPTISGELPFFEPFLTHHERQINWICLSNFEEVRTLRLILFFEGLSHWKKSLMLFQVTLFQKFSYFCEQRISHTCLSSLRNRRNHNFLYSLYLFLYKRQRDVGFINRRIYFRYSLFHKLMCISALFYCKLLFLMEIVISGKPKQQQSPAQQAPRTQQDIDVQKCADEAIEYIKLLEKRQDWKLKSEGKLTVHQIEIQGRSVIRGHIVMNLPFKQVFDFFSIPGFSRKLNNICRSFDSLYDNYGHVVAQQVMQFPGPISERETVTVNTNRIEGDKGYVGNKTINFPFKQHKGTEISIVHGSGFVITAIDANRTDVLYVSDVDPGGWIPGFVKKGVAGKRASFLEEIEPKIRELNK